MQKRYITWKSPCENIVSGIVRTINPNRPTVIYSLSAEKSGKLHREIRHCLE